MKANALFHKKKKLNCKELSSFSDLYKTLCKVVSEYSKILLLT